MRAIITVTEMPSMPGRFNYSVSVNNRHVVKGLSAGNGAEAAAAKAMEAAIKYGGKGYQVFAPKSVLDIIPPDMRQR